jgi:hypothetical protein
MAIIISISAEHGNTFVVGQEFKVLEVLMRKLISAGLAALTIAGGAVATTTPAQAAPHGGFGGGFHGGGFHGGGFRGGGFRGGGFRGAGFFGAGLLGFGLGAALAGPYYGYGYGYPYDYGYYGPGYYDGGPGYGSCVSNRQVWDPYYHRYVVQRVSYAC